MSPIEERVDEILSSKIEHVLKNVLDSKLRIKINEQAKEIIETKDFSDLIRARSGSLTEDGWFVDYLTESAQGVLDEKLLSHIEERVELNLNGDEINALVMEKFVPIVEEVIAHENIQQLVDQAIFRSIHQRIQSQEVANTIESLVHDAFQQSLDRFATNVLGKRSESL